MIKISFQEPINDEWKTWIQKCKEETDRLCACHKDNINMEVNDRLYRNQKKIYFDENGPFHGKCAYCESCIATNQPGDIEHFRPHSSVSDINFKRIEIVVEKEAKTKHPGYYWLAYDWHNLLPSCRDCNSRSKWRTKGKMIGKGDRFPVIGDYAINPGEETNEKPLLINPLDEDPSEHLEIDDSGIIFAKDERGQACIDVFGLNERTALVSRRKRVYRDAGGLVISIIHEMIRHDEMELNYFYNRIASYEAGVEPYSFAGRAGIKSEKDKLRPLYSDINNFLTR